MGGACGTHGGMKTENLKGRNQLEDPNVDGRVISEWILKK